MESRQARQNPDNLRIAIVGTSGTGKYTLSNVLAASLEMPYIPEQARVVVDDFGDNLRDMRRRDPLFFQKKVLDYQIQAEMRYTEGFVSDRSVYDTFIYLLRYCDVSPAVVSEYRRMIFEYIMKRPYSVVFFLRPGEFDPPDDGVRSVDRFYRYQVDGMFYMFLNSYSIEHYLLTGSIEERLDKALEIIDYKRKNTLSDTPKLF
jgi:nicotinamide riboside kinase